MARVKKRRKLVFDKECTRAYSFLLKYPTLQDARADVPQLTRVLKIPAKALGGYLTQASTNPRVTEHMLSHGYTREQIPAWLKCPEESPTPHNEVPHTTNQPTSGTTSSIPVNEPNKLHTPPSNPTWRIASVNGEPKAMIEWPDGRIGFEPLTDEELRDYRISMVRQEVADEFLQENAKWRREMELRRQERELERPPTPEEKAKMKADDERQQEQDAMNRINFAALYIMNNNCAAAANSEKHNRECHELMETLKNFDWKQLSPISGPTEAKVIQTIAEATLPLWPKVPSTDTIKEAFKEIEETRKSERAHTIGLAKAAIDYQNEKRSKKREALAERFPLTTPSDVDSWFHIKRK